MKQLLKLTGCLAVAGLFASCQSAQQEADYQIIPMPQEIVTASGNPFILNSSVKMQLYWHLGQNPKIRNLTN